MNREAEEAVQRLQEALLHLLYSPDLPPCNVHLFPKMGEHLKGHHFCSDDKVKAAIRTRCRPQPPEFFSDGFARLVPRCHKCVERNGDYMSKSE
ncbi:hypothetical protein JRQ81_019287 [Phrynocephalus forsythii]|uniref:Uncharacterized protein n=1 Tax=Phrynocephalus forsythii TaxID=171643 RepID=A0A9Q1AYC2_9SAUR|nr:hypothetical protein JRQ81_019287 [Phrynocephalus forsythii]